MKENFKLINVLATGSNGLLGKCFRKIEKKHPSLNFCFVNSKELNIGQKSHMQKFFKNKSFDFVINCAAYTNVEKAEKEPEKAFLVNAEGVKNLAEVCKQYNSTLIHISTDYVFDGHKNTPYTEGDVPNPINEYGKSKLAGENYIQEILDKYFIIRTSWLYSEFGHNFFKIILKKTEIEKISGKIVTLRLKNIDNYVTFARRPRYSVLGKEKVKSTFDLNIPDWKKSLRNLYSIIQ